MGNRCSRCCRRHPKPFKHSETSNYGAAANHLNYNVKPGGYMTGYSKDAHIGYVQLPTGGSGIGGGSRDLNGELRQHQFQLPRADPLVRLAPSDDIRHGRFKVVSQAPHGDYVIVTEPSNYTVSSLYKQTNNTNLQHISEREPDDTLTDPSLNPTKETLFMQRSIRDVEASLRKRRSIYDRNVSRSRQRVACLLNRSSSTATVRLDDSTITRPDPKTTVRALSHAVYLQIRNRVRHRCSSFMPEIFDERIHPLQNEPIPSDYGTHDPDHRVVYRFIRTLFQMAQLSPECAIVTMVYLERLLTNAETELTPATWKRVVLCAILLASKVWDDQAVWNVDYCQILKDLSVNDVNELERQFLEIIQFNINVPSSVYAKYYFDIRSLCGSSCHPFPLSVERACKLEAYSRVTEDTFQDDIQRSRAFRRWGSLDTLTTPPRFRPVILS